MLTIGVTMCNQELQHLIHGSHIKYDAELGDRHGDQTPQEDGRTHRAAKWLGT